MFSRKNKDLRRKRVII